MNSVEGYNAAENVVGLLVRADRSKTWVSIPNVFNGIPVHLRHRLTHELVTYDFVKLDVDKDVGVYWLYVEAT